jgi:hypothetical protein
MIDKVTLMKKKIFLLLLLLIVSKTYSQTCKSPKFEIIGQRAVENIRGNIWANQEIEFRLTNLSECPIFVKGHKTQKFYPIGFILEFDKKKKIWKSPFNNVIPDFKDLGFSELDSYEIMPKQSLIFTNVIEDSALKIKYKKVIYVSFSTSESSPKSVESPIFFLERK